MFYIKGELRLTRFYVSSFFIAESTESTTTAIPNDNTQGI